MGEIAVEIKAIFLSSELFCKFKSLIEIDSDVNVSKDMGEVI